MTDRIFSVPERVEQKDAAFEVLEQALEAGILSHWNSKSEEVFIECLLCDDWEGHKDGCPIPVIEKWLNEGPGAGPVIKTKRRA